MSGSTSTDSTQDYVNISFVNNTDSDNSIVNGNASNNENPSQKPKKQLSEENFTENHFSFSSPTEKHPESNDTPKQMEVDNGADNYLQQKLKNNDKQNNETLIQTKMEVNEHSENIQAENLSLDVVKTHEKNEQKIPPSSPSPIKSRETTNALLQQTIVDAVESVLPVDKSNNDRLSDLEPSENNILKENKKMEENIQEKTGEIVEVASPFDKSNNKSGEFATSENNVEKENTQTQEKIQEKTEETIASASHVDKNVNKINDVKASNDNIDKSTEQEIQTKTEDIKNHDNALDMSNKQPQHQHVDNRGVSHVSTNDLLLSNIEKPVESVEESSYNHKEQSNISEVPASNSQILSQHDAPTITSNNISDTINNEETALQDSSQVSSNKTETEESGKLEETGAKMEDKLVSENAAEGDNKDIFSDETPFDSNSGKSIEKEENEPEWLDILGNGLLKKKILKKGVNKKRAVAGDIVTINYEGKLDDGTVVDKTSSQTIILSDEDVNTALDLAVALMNEKEVALVDTESRYAYGILGRHDYTPPIPPNAHIVYEVEVVSIEEGKSINDLTTDEIVLYGDKKRVRGNDLYSRQDYPGSISAYRRGLKYLSQSSKENVVEMKMKLLNNLGAAQLKVKAYDMAIMSLDEVLKNDPDNVKALYRKGKCLIGLGKDDEALDFMKKAATLDPDSKLVAQDLTRLKSRLSLTQQKEKEMYQRMFQNKNPKEKEESTTDEEQGSYWQYFIGGSIVAASLSVIGGILWYKLKH